MRDISVLHPRLQEKISEFRNLCAKQGLLIGIGECWRSVEEQDALYAKGRTIPGNVVTNARGKNYESMHQWYVAFDIYRMDRKDAFYNGDGFFDRAGKIGQSIGLEWGGYWRKPDKPHYQLPDWGSTAIKLRAKYSTPEEFKLSWKEEETVTQKEFDKLMDNYLNNRKTLVPSEALTKEFEEAKKLGITDGTMPQAFATREQVAAMITRAIKQ